MRLAIVQGTARPRGARARWALHGPRRVRVCASRTPRCSSCFSLARAVQGGLTSARRRGVRCHTSEKTASTSCPRSIWVCQFIKRSARCSGWVELVEGLGDHVPDILRCPTARRDWDWIYPGPRTSRRSAGQRSTADGARRSRCDSPIRASGPLPVTHVSPAEGETPDVNWIEPGTVDFHERSLLGLPGLPDRGRAVGWGGVLQEVAQQWGWASHSAAPDGVEIHTGKSGVACAPSAGSLPGRTLEPLSKTPPKRAV